MRNQEMLNSFVAYCAQHPHERFWQALRNWSGYSDIKAGDENDYLWDTFYWEGKRHDG